MDSAVFWVVTSDAAAARRWKGLLSREGWTVAARETLDQFVHDAKLAKGMALVDCDALGKQRAQALVEAKAKARHISFLMISARELSTEAVIELLEAGGDDYFSFSIPDALVLTKLRTHLRRLLPDLSRPSGRIEAPEGDLIYDTARRELLIQGKGGWTSVSDLTTTEIKLISLFLSRPGQALERSVILESVWAEDCESVLPSTVDKHIESLRRKLGKLGSRIRAIYGVGYGYQHGGKTKEKP
ncbi:MAG: response regulator transcription factor [Elusimicrobia bacterium]|nr:response regulator transcription factor [Elusimicrobiota bacterium]